jgi:uncharacterized membrane protein
MSGWGEFVLAYSAFMVSHAIPSRPEMKASLMKVLGRGGYLVGFVILSTGLLVWLIAATERAPIIEIWMQAGWTRWLANIAMPAAVLFGSFAIGAINPFSFGGRTEGFDPAHPGIAGAARHPLLVALLIWSGAHLIANGDLAHVILFGTFAVMSVLGMWAIERRSKRLWGAEVWARISAATSNIPFAALISGAWKPTRGPSWRRVGIAVFVWAGLWHLHGPIIGLSPAP